MKTRPDSALMNEMTPIGVPEAAVIGTLIAERMPMLAQQLALLGILDRRLEQLVGDVGDQLRVAVAEHLRRAALVAGAARVALAVAARERDLLGVAVGDRDLLDRAVAVGHAHAAPVGERRHGEVGDVLQRALVVERGRERRAGAREQPLRVLRAPLLGDVLDHRHHQPRLAARVEDAARLVDAPAFLARRAVDDAQPLRRDLLAAQHAVGRVLLRRQRRPVLVVEVGELDEVGRRRAEQRVHRREPERRGGGVVGVHEPLVAILDHDRLGEVAERRGQLLAERLGADRLPARARGEDREDAAEDHDRGADLVAGVAEVVVPDPAQQRAQRRPRTRRSRSGARRRTSRRGTAPPPPSRR